MTVVDEKQQLEAFFGYNHPNENEPNASYADVGPNPILNTGVRP